MVLAAIAVALGVVGWSSGRLNEPQSGALFWTLNWGALAAGASLYLLIVAACFRRCQVPFAHLLKTSLATLGINAVVAMGLIVLSWLRVGWITLLLLPAAILCAGSVILTVGIWWVAPTFQALRDGSLPASAPFPAAAVVRRVAMIAGQVVLRSYWMSAYGIVDLLLLDAVVLAMRLGVGLIVDRH